MNVYDFDNTLYDGESTLDFFLFCCRHNFRLYRFVFVVFFTLIKYKMRLVSEKELFEKCEKYTEGFLKDCPDILLLADEFAELYKRKIKVFYTKMKRDDDCIVTASFGFLVRRLLPNVDSDRIICSEIDFDNKKVTKLCFRENKTYMFEEAFKGKRIENFYTDSLNDLPLIKLAENAYIVKKEKIKQYTIEKEKR